MSSQDVLQRKERRKTARRRMLAAARIVFNNRQSVLDCTVKNLSQGGACLRAPNMLGVPESFELWLGSSGGRYRCAAVWRTGRQIGVRFASAP